LTDTGWVREKDPTMKESKKAGATPRRFDPAFKAEAVRLWEASGRGAEHTARELGISVFHLYDWRRALRGPQRGPVPRAAAGPALSENKAELQSEVMQLRAEVSRLTEQREILKKAAGILSEPPASGMPGSKRGAANMRSN
jgi:transposase